jgi:cytochrome c biogenesis protein CcmG/thiol:disulfide interchange protein DsbE
LGFLLFQQYPVLKNNFSKTDELINSRELKVINHKENGSILFPPKDSKAIAIFWASWCKPCKVEMARLKKSVESGAIPKEAIFAINPFETDLEKKRFLAENPYPFTFIEASSLASELGVQVTPTTLFIDKGIITSMSSGMSIWGIWKAEYFL